MRIGVLCSGGDSPGMNAAIRGTVLRGTEVHGFDMFGFMDGWRGFHEGDVVPLDRLAVRGISGLGGVFLGISAFDGQRSEVAEGQRPPLNGPTTAVRIESN